MKPGLELPIPGQKLKDLRKVGNCLICHAALFSFISDDLQTECGDPDCEHPDELCSDPKCLETRKRLYIGHGAKRRKIKNPCKFPKLKHKESG